MTPIQHTFWEFIYEREMIRKRKEGLCISVTLPKGYLTMDSVLARYHFCNVNREHDRVTRWVHEHVRKRFAKGTLVNMVLQLLVARIFNEPNTLDGVLPYTTPARLRADLRRVEKLHGKLLRGAYLMVPHGKRETVISYFVPAIAAAHRKLVKAGLTYGNCRRLQVVASVLRDCPGVGPFIANQVCTDLRYVPTKLGRKQWHDWETFVLAGPGTRRGLNRYFGRKVRGPGSRIPEDEYTAEILEVRKSAPEAWKTVFRDPNNLSNCFCEFDKYQRARDSIDRGEPPTMKRIYHATKENP